MAAILPYRLPEKPNMRLIPAAQAVLALRRDGVTDEDAHYVHRRRRALLPANSKQRAGVAARPEFSRQPHLGSGMIWARSLPIPAPDMSISLMNRARWGMVAVTVSFLTHCRCVAQPPNPAIHSEQMAPPCVFECSVGSRFIHAVAYSPNNTVLAWSASDGVRFVDLKSRSNLSINAPFAHCKSMAFATDSESLLLSDANRLRRWGLENRSEWTSVSARGLNDLKVSETGLLLGVGDRDWWLWDLRTGFLRLIGHAAVNGKSLIGGAIHQDGAAFVIRDSDDQFQVWSIHPNGDQPRVKLDRQFGGSRETRATLRFNRHLFIDHHGRVVVHDAFGKLQFWDATRGVQLAAPSKIRVVNGFDLSSDDGYLVTGGADALLIWDLDADVEVNRIPLPRPVPSLSEITFSPDGSSVAAAGRFSQVAESRLYIWSTLPATATLRNIMLEDAVRQLAGLDAEAAYAALWRLREHPRAALDLVQRELDGEKSKRRDLPKLIDALGADSFEARQSAYSQILLFGDDIVPLLKRELERATCAETRASLTRLLANLKPAPFRRRAARLLKSIDSPESNAILQQIESSTTGRIVDSTR